MAAATLRSSLAVTLLAASVACGCVRAWDGGLRWYHGLEGPEFDRISDLSTEDYDMRVS